MRIVSVIGAGYGDEGKGLTVDALTRTHRAAGEVTVVRVNGGAQAGHTVQTADGRRHVFHQFGAGSLAEAQTHWAKPFVASPTFFGAERDVLTGLGARVNAVTADPDVRVATPWDVLINQAVEESRGGARHGSCGMGFGEAVERAERGWDLRLRDLGARHLADDLHHIRTVWFPKRMRALGLDPDPFASLALNDQLMEDFLRDCRTLRLGVSLVADAALGEDRFGQIITEGAQGLGLDMDVGSFPHVTRSHTGLRNVVALARDCGAEAVEAVYATRAYATRHGAGPFPGEGDVSPWADPVDPTNAPNAWQGSLRVGALDLDGMRDRMDRDAAAADLTGIAVSRTVMVSCLDQVRDAPRALRGGDDVRLSDPAAEIAEALGGVLAFTSRGPTAEAVRDEVCADGGISPA